MKLTPLARERRSPQSVAISIAVHVALAIVLATASFHVPVYVLFGGKAPDVAPEVRLTYVRAIPAAQEGQGGTAERPVFAPAPTVDRLPAPVSTPTVIPPPDPSVPVPSPGSIGVAGGTGTARTNDPVDPRAGVLPAIPDPRISLTPILPVPAPKTQAARNDSAVAAIYTEFRNAELARQALNLRAPGDWTFDRDGQKWGWDTQGIRLGKYTIPNAILAALPLNVSPQGRNINALTDARIQTWTQRDLREHSQGMSDADFRAAVKRIRDRVDREREEQKRIVADPVKPPGGE